VKSDLTGGSAMKVYICMDMEGISDVVTSYQLMPNGSSPALQEIRVYMLTAMVHNAGSDPIY